MEIRGNGHADIHTDKQIYLLKMQKLFFVIGQNHLAIGSVYWVNNTNNRVVFIT